MPIHSLMINPISSAHSSQVNEVSHPAARQPQPPAQPPKSDVLPQDTVTLKNTGDVDHDGDGK